MSMSSRTALVTGASSGIGHAIAAQLAADGARVIALARRGERLGELARNAPKPEHVTTLTVDLTDRAAVTAALAGLPAEFSSIDTLVNNAGAALGLDVSAEADIDDWDGMIAINCSALVWLTRQLLPAMLAVGRGHIVNIGSIAGTLPYRGNNVYGATKAFVAHFTRNLRADLLGTPVRATLIEPGMVGGCEFSEVRFHGDKSRADAVYAGTEPLTPADIAAAVAFALGQPAHVNVNRIELMPVCQAPDQVGVVRNRPEA